MCNANYINIFISILDKNKMKAKWVNKYKSISLFAWQGSTSEILYSKNSKHIDTYYNIDFSSFIMAPTGKDNNKNGKLGML